MAKIGVEQSLTNVAEALRSKGHQVIDLKQEADATGCDCCVITGGDANMMGIQNVATQGPVIEATGMSADEVCQCVEDRLQ
ncbi:hypothetical protein Q73_00810 [Bacillus coahuilensis m2-6]|uniref:UPF0180 protein Q75_01495 n=1 Tax=Bacillus coahuilensis p1.1.43 TaxID=1150625 RepID=A0A147KC40_9BACI|nr:YkuS family protein [Bacillus coahuilensis]KUP09138.1 hypothetical protein Q75_01495 [Bacillus coahuilensis p1.1.43]KUP09816.1 hypothetical protein Q73_00810 [Bacillus coahuilensis m2-6]